MKLSNDFGCFFMKMNDAKRGVESVIYVKTNYLLKNAPSLKLTYFDAIKKTFVTKPHSPNKIWFVRFYKGGLDGPSMEDVTVKEFESMLKKDAEEIYNYLDYTPIELYDKMKGAKTGLKPAFSKNWFTKEYSSINEQIRIILTKSKS
jgi:hypothetical protein